MKRNDTCGKNSRYYKFEIKKKYGDKKRDLWKPKPKGDFKTDKTPIKKGIDLKNKLKEIRENDGSSSGDQLDEQKSEQR